MAPITGATIAELAGKLNIPAATLEHTGRFNLSVTGEQWTRSSEDVQKAYLVGVANLTQVENAYFEGNPPSDKQSFVPRLVKGLQGQTLDSVREGLNRWYAANPGKLQRPVIETIWFEMAVPGLQKNK